MAAPWGRFFTIFLCYVLAAFVSVTHFCIHCYASSEPNLYAEPSEIFELVKRQCVVGLLPSENHDDDKLYDDVYKQLEVAFHYERNVALRRIDYTPDNFYWDRKETLRWISKPTDIITKQTIVIFKKKERNRSCLILPETKSYPKAEAYSGPRDANYVLEFVNDRCGTYRSLNGKLSVQGLHREHLLEHLFSVKSISNVTMQKWAGRERDDSKSCSSCWGIPRREEKKNDRESCSIASDSQEDGETTEQCEKTQSTSGKPNLPKCERISVPSSWEQFFNHHLKISRPVVIENAFNHWPAMKKWSTKFLRSKYGTEKVHIKLAPNGHFEGVEKASLWEDFATFDVPDQVKDALQFPDLVVVRPATMNMNFSDFLDTMTGNSSFAKKGNSDDRISAYLEYSSIPQYLPELEQDIESFPFIKNKLKRKHLNIWLSDGNTLGKLHFDPFDNFLCQIKGRKELILFQPHDNTKLYEAHIPEALLGFNEETGEFRRKTLMESTSMVMAPVDLKEPDFERFPYFAGTYPLNCTIDEGDMLFMPAFWWHEVQSYPNLEESRNVAVNFWFEPFLTKEFPCPYCRLDVNPYYRHLL